VSTITTKDGSEGLPSSGGVTPQGLELRHLRYFVAVADAGNFTHAAERMFIAQPALSQQIRRLEEIIGTPLLQRRREGLRPGGWRGPRRRPARRRRRRKPNRPGRPRPACGAVGCSGLIRARSGTPSRTTGRQGRRCSCLRPWRTWPPCWRSAAVLAQRGRDDEARAALNEAVSLYEDLDARWDIRRADSRLRAHGIRRGVRGRRGPRAASGWEALTPTELRSATMVAGGASTPDIAWGMFLSRRTVQSYISHILAKLGAKGRVEIVREALRQGISP